MPNGQSKTGRSATSAAYDRLRDFVDYFNGMSDNDKEAFTTGTWDYKLGVLTAFGFTSDEISALAVDARVVTSEELAQGSGIGYWLW